MCILIPSLIVSFKVWVCVCVYSCNEREKEKIEKKRLIDKEKKER